MWAAHGNPSRQRLGRRVAPTRNQDPLGFAGKRQEASVVPHQCGRAIRDPLRCSEMLPRPDRAVDLVHVDQRSSEDASPPLHPKHPGDAPVDTLLGELSILERCHNSGNGEAQVLGHEQLVHAGAQGQHRDLGVIVQGAHALHL